MYTMQFFTKAFFVWEFIKMQAKISVNSHWLHLSDGTC